MNRQAQAVVMLLFGGAIVKASITIIGDPTLQVITRVLVKMPVPTTFVTIKAIAGTTVRVRESVACRPSCLSACIMPHARIAPTPGGTKQNVSYANMESWN